jgi:hypothetical protein
MADDEVHTTSGWIKLAKHDHCMLHTSDYKLFEHFLVLICMGQEAETALINAITLAVEIWFFGVHEL